MEFLFDLTANGVLVGLMYSLVALGFVLIYKATSVINFAQGDLLMFAGYAAAVMTGGAGMPLWAMLIVLAVGMVALGFVLERGILRPMVGQPVVSVIMVTIGLSFALQGLVTIIWGANTRELALPVRFDPYIVGPVYVSPINLLAAAIAILFLIGFGVFFTHSRLGVAMRAVADDQQASMVVGIKVPRCSRSHGPSPAWPRRRAASSGATRSAWTPSWPWSGSRSFRWSFSAGWTASAAPSSAAC